ncbi:hypothetical protein XENOCAPTIV_028737 [Xenoophorus captivus]|uniref:Uncharacterized protein n=1 Tax=Xenoophorus captivus TaxID=1517983 RepID=A0ABV0QNJ3_9TELE
MIESALAGLQCNIQKEKQISSNSISVFQRGGSSKLDSTVLHCPKGAPKEGYTTEAKVDETVHFQRSLFFRVRREASEVERRNADDVAGKKRFPCRDPSCEIADG